MGRLARQFRRELAYETVDDVGEENDENTAYCNILVSSFLSPIVCFYVYRQPLRKLRLYLCSLDQGHSVSSCNDHFSSESICVRHEIGKFSKGF